MKTYTKIFVTLAASAIAFSACQREINPSLDSVENKISISVHASADEIAADADSKTYLDTYNGQANTVLWGNNEFLKIAITAGGATHFATSVENTEINGLPSATFSFAVDEFEGTPESYLYQGLYPASAAVAKNNTNPANYKVNLPSTQNATASTYDPSAYIMVAKPEEKSSLDDWTASFRRATALNKITLKNISSEVSIKRVKISAPEGKYLAGARHINLSTGESSDIYAGGGRTESVEVKFASPISGGSDIDVWFTSWDVEVEAGEKLSIVAYTTDNNSYTKEITVPSGKSIKFQEGYLNILGANMSGIEPQEVTELQEGNYVILADNNGTYYALKAAAENTRMAYESYTGSTSLNDGSNSSIVWAVSKFEGSYIFAHGDNYLGWTSGNTASMNEPGDSWTTANYLLDVTYDNNNNSYKVNVTQESTRILAKNNDSNYGFGFYTGSGYNHILFVPVDSRTPVELTFDEEQVELTPAEAADYLGQDVTISPTASAISEHLVWSYEDNDDIIDEFDEGALTLNGDEGTATITVSFAGDDNYLPASASYTITVINELTLTFPFDTAISGWPSSSSASAAGSYTYSLSGTDYTFTHTKEGNGIYCQSSYLMIVSGNYLGLPAISGYKLISVSAKLNPGGSPSTAAKGKITSDISGTVVSGGEEQIFDTKGGSKTFNLSGTAENTVYYLAISNKNFQCTEIVLVYEATSVDTREETGMSWSSDTASATITDGVPDAFTAPILDQGYASSVAYSSSNTSVATINSTTGVVTIVGAGETVISASFEGDSNYKPAAVSYTLTVTNIYTIQTVTVSQFLAAEESAVCWYQLTGVISNILDTTYGNFTLTDSTGSIYVYGLTATEQSTNDKSFSSLGLEDGFTVTIVAHRSSHNDNPQAGGAYYVSHVPIPTLHVSPTELVFDASGGSSSVTASADHFDGTVTISASSNNVQFTTSVSGNSVTITASQNQTTSSITGEITVTATDGVNTKSATVNVSQNATVPPASDGETLWAEAFAGFDADAVPSVSNASTTVYGNGTVIYACSNGGTNTKIYAAALAGGQSPELLVSKNGGKFTVSDIPTGKATDMTLSFKANNNGKIAVSTTTTGATIASNIGTATAPIYVITVPANTSSLSLTFTNSDGGNTRVDDFMLVVGVPPVTLSSIAVSDQTTSFTVGDTFSFDGTVTATYSDGSTADVTSSATVSNPDMSTQGSKTVTVSYTEDGVTKTASYNITVSAGGGGTSHTSQINFGNSGTKINAASVTGDDSEGNTWTVTTVGTTSFTSSSGYYQVGSSSKPATSITFTTTLASRATNIGLEAKFGGFSGTAGTVTLNVGNTSIGSGSLNGTNDVTVTSSSTGSGTVLTVTVTGISKGVKCYYIKATYTN